jgi:polyisoprenoid-binding protein YceI
MVRPRRRPFASLLGALALAAPAAAWAADSYQVDPEHASVVFKIRHLGMSDVYGRFDHVAGTFALDEQDPGKSTFDITIDADSVDTGNARRDRHLKSADFFDVGQFPTIHFASKQVRHPEPSAWEITGELTLHGVTKPLTLTVTKIGAGADPWGHQRMGGAATFTVKRSDFGMAFMPDAVGDEVTLMISLEGVKQ